MESMKKFAGDDPKPAKYHSKDDHFLLEKEEHVDIYGVFYVNKVKIHVNYERKRMNHCFS